MKGAICKVLSLEYTGKKQKLVKDKSVTALPIISQCS